MGVPSEKYLSQMASNVPSALIFARYSFVFARSSLSLEFTPKAYYSSERAISITFTFELSVFPHDTNASAQSNIATESTIEIIFFIFYVLLDKLLRLCAVFFCMNT